jgi:hypothetical protein
VRSRLGRPLLPAACPALRGPAGARMCTSWRPCASDHAGCYDTRPWGLWCFSAEALVPADLAAAEAVRRADRASRPQAPAIQRRPAPVPPRLPGSRFDRRRDSCDRRDRCRSRFGRQQRSASCELGVVGSSLPVGNAHGGISVCREFWGCFWRVAQQCPPPANPQPATGPGGATRSAMRTLVTSLASSAGLATVALLAWPVTERRSCARTRTGCAGNRYRPLPGTTLRHRRQRQAKRHRLALAR